MRVWDSGFRVLGFGISVTRSVASQVRRRLGGSRVVEGLGFRVLKALVVNTFIYIVLTLSW